MIFKKADWIHNTNVYEVNLRQYTKEGTLKAFEKELPRLKDMGVAVLWFMPITPIAQKNKKGSMGSYYACSDYTAVSEEFGTLSDFRSFVQLAHEMGFKVIIDWVANHTGWDHVWTQANPGYYKHDFETNDFKIASGMDDIIELDYTNPGMRTAMIEAMRFWINECDIDGFRCDLAAWVQLDFWIQARTALEQTKTLFWLAECDGIENANYYAAFDACYCWTWMHKTFEFYNHNRDKKMLDGILQHYSHVTNDTDQVLWYTSNHDENSWNGTEYEKYGAAAKAFAIHSFTWNGMPLIYSGQELPNNKRLQFFDKDPIEWTGKYLLHDFYKTLTNLHTNNPALRGGDPAVTTYLLQTNADHNVLAYLRKNNQDEVLVLLNFSDQEIDCMLYDEKAGGHFKNIFTNEVINMNEHRHFNMKGWDYFVFEKS
ncbi:MAG: alpha-amylase family glycosyl hydrolase [Ferruginibacter sp.]